MEKTDEIIERCKKGDKEAYRHIVQKYQRMIFTLSIKMLGDEEEAKDTTQETFIRAWERLCEYDNKKSFTTWIYTIATHFCIDRIRKAERLTPLPNEEITLYGYINDKNPQRTLESRELAAIIRALARNLSTKQRVVFTLCQLEGRTTEETEELTGLTAQQIKSNLYVARQTIREQLKKMGYE